MDKQYNPDGFIPKYGGYERLITYQKAEIIYDGSIISVKSIFNGMTEPLARWFRQHARENKT